ncbi:hypothetical protein LUCX_97 [Xanthomonas phage vB_XciM_LucasX]|nr:hypothetical protein LUCX_97 [Xanthomonas phage vB_XciM_LucasX]
MIIYEGPGDLFSCGMQCITCSINTVGAMGKGIALEFKRLVPGLYEYYRQHYHDKPPLFPSVNKVLVYNVDAERKVLLLPTKDHWVYPSKVELIDRNLQVLTETYRELGIESLGLPLIGCGHNTGQLSWERQVRPLVYQHLDPLPIPVKILTG